MQHVWDGRADERDTRIRKSVQLSVYHKASMNNFSFSVKAVSFILSPRSDDRTNISLMPSHIISFPLLRPENSPVHLPRPSLLFLSNQLMIAFWGRFKAE